MNLDPQQVTIIGLLFAIGVAGMRQVWVWGWTYAEMAKSKDEDLVEMTKDRDFWRDTALKALGHTDKALDIAKTQQTDA